LRERVCEEAAKMSSAPFRAAKTALLQAFPDLHYETEQLMTSGDHVIVQSHLSGTHKGTFAGIAPTNKKVSWHSCTVVELRNGKAIRNRVYADNVTLFRQLGTLATPKAATAG
jgi:predicted ester cyclase